METRRLRLAAADLYDADLCEEEFGDTYTIQLDGEWTNDDLKSLGEKLKEITGKHITLDMANATGITTIEEKTFADCANLASVTIPASVTYIGSEAFYNCRSLAAVEIPEGVTSIGDAAFRGCASLKAVTIPEGVTSIRYSVFEGCTSLASVTFADTSNWYDIESHNYTGDNHPIDVTNPATNANNLKSYPSKRYDKHLIMDPFFDYCQ